MCVCVCVCVCVCELDLALNDTQGLIYSKSPTNIPLSFNFNLSKLSFMLCRYQFNFTSQLVLLNLIYTREYEILNIMPNISYDMLYLYLHTLFANCPEDLGSISGRVIPNTLKIVLDTTLHNTQRYKIRFKGKVEQSKERSSALHYTLV